MTTPPPIISIKTVITRARCIDRVSLSRPSLSLPITHLIYTSNVPHCILSTEFIWHLILLNHSFCFKCVRVQHNPVGLSCFPILDYQPSPYSCIFPRCTTWSYFPNTTTFTGNPTPSQLFTCVSSNLISCIFYPTMVFSWPVYRISPAHQILQWQIIRSRIAAAQPVIPCDILSFRIVLP